MYVGFEIEVESCKENHAYPLHALIEEAYPITGWSKHQGISSYHSYKNLSQQGLWRVENDASLTNGAEFIMPPLDKNTSFDLLEKFFELIKNSECYTSLKCGLHLNISNDTRTIDNVDIGYFIANANYRLLAKLWPDRAKKYNCYSIGLKHILSNIVYNKSISTSLTQQKNFQKEISKNHNYMINVRSDIRRTVKERFEIRAMGGKDYHKKLEEIKITTNMFEDLLEKSSRPIQNTNKKIISYINRVHSRRELKIGVWIPKINIEPRINVNNEILLCNLSSIKNIHKHGAWQFLEKISTQYNNFSYRQFFNKSKYFNPYFHFNTYLYLILHAVNNVISSNINRQGLQNNDHINNKIIKLTNEAIYHVVKYISNNPTVFSPKMCNKLIKKYMIKPVVSENKKIINSEITHTIPEITSKIILTIPESEKQHDIIWLSKHMYMFDTDTRQKYINRLSIHTINFINKHKKKYGKGILRMSQKKKKELIN